MVRWRAVDVHTALAPLARRLFRGRRLAAASAALGLTPATRVLDVGGTATYWREAPVRPRLTLLNLYPTPAPGAEAVVGDGVALPFRDGAFEVVVSNSVIEHLGTFARQRAFAAECRRVGRRVWVQTPDRAFPIEPHYLAPVVHWLPRAVQRRVVRWMTPWGLLGRPTQADADAFVAELRLLSAREVAALFPDCRLVRERVLGLTKSLVALRD